MCVVSMTADMFRHRWEPLDYTPKPWSRVPPPRKPTQEEFDDLKKEVEILKDLLKKSKEYDEKNNEPDCEIEEKMKFLRKVAKSVGISLDDVIPPK